MAWLIKHLSLVVALAWKSLQFRDRLYQVCTDVTGLVRDALKNISISYIVTVWDVFLTDVLHVTWGETWKVSVWYGSKHWTFRTTCWLFQPKYLVWQSAANPSGEIHNFLHKLRWGSHGIYLCLYSGCIVCRNQWAARKQSAFSSWPQWHTTHYLSYRCWSV